MSGSAEEAPKDFSNLRALIAQRFESLPKRLAQVAAYALQYPDEVAFGTVASIASEAGVQPSALIRFSHALGYRGFSDLQEIFRSRLRERVLNYDERLTRVRESAIASSRTGSLLGGFMEAAERSLASLRESIDTDRLDEAVELLADADTIYLVGLRRSFPIVAYLNYAMSQSGIRNVLVDAAAGLGIEQIGFMGHEDVALAISFAPYASQTVTLVNTAASRGARIVSIADSVFSPIAAPAQVFLEVQEADFQGFRSLAATMTLAMSLTVAIATRRTPAGR